MTQSLEPAGWRRWKHELRQWWLRQKCPTEFLCDNCKYDHPSACHRPERPNAIKCPDYRPRT
ncbi:MAG TPA: hypothetical protein ENN29_07155 [Candidatus Hydrogenedentes bacterium]|nr:hypothetical protein [Candidatus Hydrogenedentota bacterium]